MELSTRYAVPLVGDLEYAPLLSAVRRLLDAVTAADPPAELVATVAADLSRLSASLEGYEQPWQTAPACWRFDLPGRGHPLLAPFVVSEETPDSVTGTVTFTRAHMAGGEAVYGGMLPLLFDDVLGMLANRRTTPSPTAYLNVDFRRPTPTGIALTVEAHIERIEGRKVFIVGTLSNDGEILAEANGLFVQLNTEQS